MAQTPEQAGTSSRGSLRLKKAAVALHLYFTFSHHGNMKLLGIFGVVAMTVPPPVGLVTAVITVAAISAVQGTGRRLSYAFRAARGYAQPGDFDILSTFNRMQHETPHYVRIPQPGTHIARLAYGREN